MLKQYGLVVAREGGGGDVTTPPEGSSARSRSSSLTTPSRQRAVELQEGFIRPGLLRKRWGPMQTQVALTSLPPPSRDITTQQTNCTANRI